MKRYCFIYNPSANPSVSRRQFEKIRSKTSLWSKTEYFISESRGDIKDFAGSVVNEFEVLVACGGDGTVNEVASALLNTKASLGVIPLGSGNDFAKSINVPKNLNTALEILKKREKQKIDAGRCNETFFINTLGFGFDGLTTYYALGSRLPASLRYLFAALKTGLTMVPLNARIKSEDFAGEETLLMLTIANGRVEGGSFRIAPEAQIDDGMFEVLKVTPVSKWILPFLLPWFIVGRHKRLKQVDFFQASELDIVFDEVPSLHADGEVIRTHSRKFRIELLPSAVNVVGSF